MGLTQNIHFGIHQVTAYDPATGLYHGTAKVVAEATAALSGELIKAQGGSNPFPWAIENGRINTEITVKMRELPDMLWKLLMGQAVTAISAEASGYASAITNQEGESVVDASTGIASVGVKSGSEADVKFSKFLVVAVSPTTVDVYAGTDVDFKRGSKGSYQNNLLKITESPLTITAATPVTIPNFGLELTGGSGTIAMTVDDTAEFESRPINEGGITVRVGQQGAVFPEFGLLMVGQQRSNGQLCMIDVFRAKALGFPLGMAENAFGEPELKLESFYDSDKDGVFDYTRIVT